MAGIEIRRTHHSLLPWRLYADGKQIPHSSCQTRGDVDNLRTRLEQVADWTQMNTWPEETFAAIRAILATTDSSRLRERARQRLLEDLEESSLVDLEKSRKVK